MITLDKRTIYFSPDDDTVTGYLNWVNAQKEMIRIADYSFNLKPLVELLIQKHKNGVDVQLVLDKSQSQGVTEKPEVLALQQAGVPMVIGTSSKHKIMHNKFTVGDASCQYGSWNYTQVASDESNFFVIDEEPLVAQYFLNTWTEMWDWIKQNES